MDLCFSEGIPEKPICNHNIDWDEITHIVNMTYNVFPNSLAEEALFYLMFGHDAWVTKI